MHAYLLATTARESLAELKGSHTIRVTQREQQRRRLLKQERTYARAARGFGALLTAVNMVADDFEAMYLPDGKPNRVALAELYDQTDDIAHPILGVLPPVGDYGDNDPRRDAVVQADRLLRYILLKAQTPRVTPPTESV